MKRIIFVLIITMFLGCSKSSIIIMPEYKGKKIRDVSLAIESFPNSILIDNEDDVTDDLGEGNPTEIYYNFFKKNFRYYVRHNSYFKRVDFVEFQEKNNFEDVLLEINKKEKIKFKIPTKDFVFGTDSLKHNFILFVKKLKIIRSAGQPGIPIVGANGIMMMTGGSGPSLNKTLTFLLWDNNESKIVTYGKASSTTGFAFAMTDGTWEHGINDLCKVLLKKSPFYNHSTYRTKFKEKK